MEKDKSYKTFIIDDFRYKTLYSKKYENRKSYEFVNQNLIKAFLPGKILKVLVKEGDEVNIGSDLCILEAMKMENRLKSPINAKVLKINIEEGEKVSKSTLLMELEPILDDNA